ncbi:MAG: TetR/AcrR family transcriptional regulator [Cyclobacteriaceae bacterium]
MKQKIVEGAEKLFMQYGVRSVSMDDVAREVSMSKKTLYQHFSNKDALVSEVGRHHMEKEKIELSNATSQAQNAIEELHLLSRCMRENIFKMNPSLLYDLQKYHREAWDIFKEFKQSFVKGHIVKNLTQGIEEGCYRKEIDPEVLAIVRLETIQLIFNQEVFPSNTFNFSDVQLQVFDHFVHGILTEKGKKLYQQYQQLESKPTIK